MGRNLISFVVEFSKRDGFPRTMHDDGRSVWVRLRC